MSLPITWQAPEITFLAFSWKLKCRRRGSGRDPSTLRFTGSRVGAATVWWEPSQGLGLARRKDAFAGMQPWERERAESQAGKARKGSRQEGACAELRRVRRCKLLQPCSPALLSSPAWLCAHACSPKGKCDKAEAVCHPLETCVQGSVGMCCWAHLHRRAATSRGSCFGYSSFVCGECPALEGSFPTAHPTVRGGKVGTGDHWDSSGTALGSWLCALRACQLPWLGLEEGTTSQN